MFSPRGSFAACLLLALGLAASPTRAQIVYGQTPQVGLDLVATHWELTLEDEEVTVDQFAIPVTTFLPLREDLEARLYVAQSTSSVSQLGQEFNLSGLTDMRVQISQSLSRDRLVLGIGVNLPTGHKGLSLVEEWVVMNYLTQSFLNFPVRRLGGGFGLNFLVGGAKEYGNYRLGLSASYDLASSYEAYVDEGDYNPGNSVNLTAGLQHEQDDRLVNADLTFITSAADKLADEPVFSRGQQVVAHLGVSGVSGEKRYHGNAYYHVRGRNTIYDPDGILLQQLKVYGNEFILGGGIDLRHRAKWRYGPRADIRLIAGNEFGFGKSTVLGIGGQAAWLITSRIEVRLALKYYTGSTHDGEIDLSGHQAWISAGGTF